MLRRFRHPHFSRKPHSVFLEPLESRALLSAVEQSEALSTTSYFSNVDPTRFFSIDFVTQPQIVTTNKPFSVSVQIKDGTGQPTLSDGVAVTLELDAGGRGNLYGTFTQATHNGVATFSDLTFSFPGRFGLSAKTGTTFAHSNLITAIGPNSPHLAFFKDPHYGAAGNLRSFKVGVLTSAGKRNTRSHADISVSLFASPAGGKLLGTLTATARDGIATFSNVRIPKVGSYTLRATDRSEIAGISAKFVIVPARAVKMSFLALPSQMARGDHFAAKVTVLDRYGNIADANTSRIILSLGIHPKNAALHGTLAFPVIQGVANFPNLLLTMPGQYTLLADSNHKLPRAASEKFVVQ